MTSLPSNHSYLNNSPNHNDNNMNSNNEDDGLFFASTNKTSPLSSIKKTKKLGWSDYCYNNNNIDDSISSYGNDDYEDDEKGMNKKVSTSTNMKSTIMKSSTKTDLNYNDDDDYNDYDSVKQQKLRYNNNHNSSRRTYNSTTPSSSTSTMSTTTCRRLLYIQLLLFLSFGCIFTEFLFTNSNQEEDQRQLLLGSSSSSSLPFSSTSLSASLSHSNENNHHNNHEGIINTTISQQIMMKKNEQSLPNGEPTIVNVIEQDKDGVGMEDIKNREVKHQQRIVPTTTTTMVNSNNNMNSNTGNINNYTAVIHIGPLKTGSSSIQDEMRRLINELHHDHYEIPTTSIDEYDMGELRFCMVDGPKHDLCNYGQYNKLLELGGTNGNGPLSNLLISAESFSFPDTNITQFQQLLKPWGNNNVVIVMYYRRYYDWLYSSWNQNQKILSIPERKSFVQYMNEVEIMGGQKLENMFSNGHYTYGLVSRWKVYFTNVQVYNVHDERDVSNTQKFYCNAMINAYETCSTLQKYEKRRGELHFNQGRDFIYEEIAYYSTYHMKLIPPDQYNINQIASLIQYQQETIWNLTKYDFIQSSITCLSNTLLQYLYDKTVIAEHELFPEYYNDPIVGVNHMKEQFQHDATTKLCSINAIHVLENDTKWKKAILEIILPILQNGDKQ